MPPRTGTVREAHPAWCSKLGSAPLWSRQETRPRLPSAEEESAEGAGPVREGGVYGQGAVLGRVIPALVVPRLLSTPPLMPVTR